MKQLQSNPLRTKMLTSGSLSALQELLASWIAQDRNKNGHYFTSRVPKMAAYGAFISAPLGHILINILQRLFAGRTSLKSKILQILVSNLVVSSLWSAALSLADIVSGCSYSEYRLPYLYGHHRRCPHLPSSACHSANRLHASHEGYLGHIPNLPCLCAAVSPSRDLGAFLQHCRLLHWNLHQLTHQEEEAGRFEEEALRRWQRRQELYRSS